MRVEPSDCTWLRVCNWLTLGDALGVALPVRAWELVRLPVAEALPSWEAVVVVEAIAVPETLPACDGEALVVADMLRVAACESDLVWVTDGVAPCDELGVVVDVRVPEGLEICELVSDGVGVGVMACVRVEPGDCTWLDVTPCVCVELCVGVRLSEAVLVPVRDDVDVGDCDDVRDALGRRIDVVSTLRQQGPAAYERGAVRGSQTWTQRTGTCSSRATPRTQRLGRLQYLPPGASRSCSPSPH